MSEKFETPQLSENEILTMTKSFPCIEARVLIGGDVLIIVSKKDTWLIRDEVRFYTLFHKGTIVSKGRTKEKYHIQDVFMITNIYSLV